MGLIANRFGGGDNTLTLALADDAVDMGYTYTLEPLRAGGSQQFEFELDVLAEERGVFFVNGQASTETATATNNILEANEPLQTAFQADPVSTDNDSLALMVDQCSVTVNGSGNRRIRYAPNDTTNEPILYVNAEGVITILNNFPGQWANVPDGNPNDWGVGTRVSIVATGWQTFGGTDWLSVTLQNENGARINAYMGLRTEGTPEDFLSLGCPETTLPGYAGPQPTATPTQLGPTATPDPLDWYVICTLRPNEPPPIEVNVRSAPNVTNSTIITTLGAGDRVRRTSLSASNEVSVAGTNIIFVEIAWQSGVAWVARQDALGVLLLPARGPECPPVTPTPTATPSPALTSTPDPRIPLVSPGRFANAPGGYQSPFGNGNAPANVGSLGIHQNGTIDVMPASLEECIDTSRASVSSSCDPQGTLGNPVYAPVSGTAYAVDNGQNIVIFWEVEFDRNDDDTNRPVRREILLIHLDPTQTLVPVTGIQVRRGDLVGYLCRFDDRQRCGIPDNVDRDIGFAVNHLAVQIRFYTSNSGNGRPGAFAPSHDEVLGVLAIPNCIFDNWVENHLVRTPKDLETATWLVNWFAACPSN